MERLLLAALCYVVLFVAAGSAGAESRFGTAMKKHYRLRSVSCNTCHVKGEEKDVVNPFGQTVGKLIDGKRLSDKITAAKEADSETRQKVYAEVEKEFIAALKKLDKMKTPSGKTYAQAIPAGEIEGIKLRE